MRGTGRAFGTFGELLQGVLPDTNLDFLVTLPITRFSTAAFEYRPDLTEVVVLPAHKDKARLLAERILLQFEKFGGGVLTITSELPEGKGLASSSADLMATLRAVEACLAISITTEEANQFLGEIEPTDGVMYDGIVAYYHRKAKLCRIIGDLSRLTIVGVDEGGVVDTVEFNKLPKPFSYEEKLEYRRLLDEITEAIQHRDLAAVGRVASLSAEMNQTLRHKLTLKEMQKLSHEIGGLGTVVAHSGTFVGLMLCEYAPDYQQQLSRACDYLRSIGRTPEIFYSLCFEKEGDYNNVQAGRSLVDRRYTAGSPPP